MGAGAAGECGGVLEVHHARIDRDRARQRIGRGERQRAGVVLDERAEGRSGSPQRRVAGSANRQRITRTRDAAGERQRTADGIDDGRRTERDGAGKHVGAREAAQGA